MKLLRENKNLKGIIVLLRLDLNVPVAKGRVVNDFRIRRILPTVNFLKKVGARIVVMSHIETAEADGGQTLAPVATYMKTLGVSSTFVTNYRTARATIDAMKEGDLVMLENLRENEGEKKNDPAFARELASLGDIYVNDAFAVSHRAHASVSAITACLPSYAGLLFEQEVVALSSAFHPDPLKERPFLFVLGGAKFETKLPLIERFMALADSVFVGGALANDFFKEKGLEIGTSKVSSGAVSADGTLDAPGFNLKRFVDNSKLLLPSDVITKNLQDADSAAKSSPLIKPLSAVVTGEAILDAGPETVRLLGEQIAAAKYILWNGPLGAYEKGFKEPTLALARMVAAATGRGARTIVGGGDTLATIAELGIEEKFTFVSTGGGAMLDFLATGTLPGIEALEKSS